MSNNKAMRVNELSAHGQSLAWLVKFVDIYQQLSIDNLQLLNEVYHRDIIFIDPLHQLSGIEQFNHYFKQLYQNLNYCNFYIEHVLVDGEEATIYWQMNYQHPRLNSGKVVSVQGSSHLKGVEDKVIYHRDYLDLGAMLYEQLPLFGRIIRWFKKKAVS